MSTVVCVCACMCTSKLLQMQPAHAYDHGRTTGTKVPHNRSRSGSSSSTDNSNRHKVVDQKNCACENFIKLCLWVVFVGWVRGGGFEAQPAERRFVQLDYAVLSWQCVYYYNSALHLWMDT